MSSGGGGGGLTAEQNEINALTLKRLKTEEEELEKTEAEKRRILASGRTGRSSLLTLGFLGPGSGSFLSRASTRAAEREKQKTGAATARAAALKPSTVLRPRSPNRSAFGGGPGRGSERAAKRAERKRNEQIDILIAKEFG